MEIPVSSFISSSWEKLSDEEFMKMVNKLDEYEPYIKSKEFRKQNMNFILENDLSGYELIGRDCMVTI